LIKGVSFKKGAFTAPALVSILIAFLLGFFTNIFPTLAASNVQAAIPAATGGPILACIASSITDNSSIKLGGRPIIPGSLLRISSSGNCLASETGLNLQKGLVRTVVVSPALNSDNSENPTTSGQALLNALAALTNVNPAPSANNPYLLKLEPGIYNVGNQPLHLLPYVDFEGSGQNITIINSSAAANGLVPTQGAVVAASNSALRSVKIIENVTSPYSTALFVPGGVTNFSINETILSAAGASALNYALYNNGGTVLVQNSAVSVSDNSFINFAVDNHGGTLTVQGSSILAISSGFSEALLSEGPTTVLNSTISATGGTNSYAINIISDSLTVQNSSLSVSGASADNVTINNGSGLTIEASELTAAGGSNVTSAIRNSGTAIVKSSNLSAAGGTNNYGFYNYAGSAKIVVSQLAGSPAVAGGVGVICIGDYTGSFTTLNSICS
jgi:hypothetical protein